MVMAFASSFSKNFTMIFHCCQDLINWFSITFVSLSVSVNNQPKYLNSLACSSFYHTQRNLSSQLCAAHLVVFFFFFCLPFWHASVFWYCSMFLVNTLHALHCSSSLSCQDDCFCCRMFKTGILVHSVFVFASDSTN